MLVRANYHSRVVALGQYFIDFDYPFSSTQTSLFCPEGDEQFEHLLKKSKFLITNTEAIIFFIHTPCRISYQSITHNLIREVLIQSCSARAKNFTNYVFCHPQLSGVIQNIENHCAILTPCLSMSIIIKITNFIE